MDNTLTFGGVIVIAFIAVIFAFMLGYCVKARLNQRQIDELVVVLRRPPTHGAAVHNAI